ncbi:putative bifunctional diguanylate cyclase/phosphodiesterase [Actinoplanes derwentensis]|uniref:Diguanylate cyclase (GGDEF) domain-containing protein n=1 Tax=Actinoplanes derwentensis TaxID=113562 RepID=A0A1H2DF60_9ACTN|nr:bifunctional diguanylate cyclase/phosphodiesterase [Actinoplanes derwentensis]SDT81227.1 diguanylate cyclase (GGDEF) domain-containing protein [Actinoplanes derwentensis]
MSTGPRLPRKLGEIGVPTTPIPADTPIGDVESILAADALVPGVIVTTGSSVAGSSVAGGGFRLLSRAVVDRFRSTTADPSVTVCQVAGAATLELAADTDIDVAAEAALARPAAEREEPVLVCWPDGRYGIAPIVDLLAAMAGRFARLSRTDPLTGLPNRSTAQAEGQRRLDDGTLTVVVHLGLDRFQDANDVLGHHGADTLLSLVAGTLRSATGTGNLAARLDGDQFVVLLSELPPGQTPQSVGRRLAAGIRGPHPVDGLPISVEASIGISHADHHDVTVLMRRAAAAMRRAKFDRTGVVEWTPNLDTNQRVDLRQLTELRAGLRSGHLRLHYQPLHDAKTRRIHGAEALVRWQHPQRGLLPPGVFLPDAERSDVILELTDWVLAEALHQASVWQAAGHHIPVSVNLPPAYLAQDRAVGTILTLLDLEQVPATMLTVEITETAVLTRPEQVAAQLTELRARGVRVAIDDFGTGYTSLGLLPELPIDELKIDRSFVIRMHDSVAHATIIDSVIAIARSLGMTVVAEGVEDEPTAADLTTAGVDLLQGFGLNRPKPPEFLPGLLSASGAAYATP